jgi:hypothetical protein
MGWRAGLQFPAREKNFFPCSTSSRPAQGSAQPHIQWVPGSLSPRVLWPGREANCSTPSSAEVTEDAAIPPVPHMSVWPGAPIKHKDNPLKKKKKLRGFSPQANYTDQATAACQRS